MSARRYISSHNFDDPANPSWSPDYLSSLKSARESRQYGGDVMMEYIYSEPRRIRKHVQGPAEGYHHPNEINGVRILRKGRGVRPLEHHQAVEEDELSPSLSHHRKGKPSALQTADTTGSSGGGYSRRVLSYKGCIYPVDQVEQPWLLKSRGKPAHVPPEQNEQQWPSKGKKIITGRSHVHHGMFFGWNPDAEPQAPAVPAATTATDVQQQQHEKHGKRAAPQHNRSSIVFG